MDLRAFFNLFEPQNIEQEMSNDEVFTSSFCGSLLEIRYSMKPLREAAASLFPFTVIKQGRSLGQFPIEFWSAVG